MDLKTRPSDWSERKAVAVKSAYEDIPSEYPRSPNDPARPMSVQEWAELMKGEKVYVDATFLRFLSIFWNYIIVVVQVTVRHLCIFTLFMFPQW